ncbi:cupin domain-containing protein [Actinacidiphila oryziradicis]|uniref:Cupin domain-containing protein n=1 Tax=Actinacidiphila oryziradicis TaxID=2571141 RepID=A0A4U0SPL0_9ACTN|nr:cupin domain-containing protein [Actinacidiphila oryziradicis]TKA11218.1 cupin domain-containing protein [Actinacidiphila oryziradicis]
MTGHTDNEIVVDAPIDFVWTVTNDIRAWPELFTEYSSTEVLEESAESVTFRLTMHPDENGNEWSWVSRRESDRASWTVRSQRVETGFFEYMHLRWDYQPVGEDRTKMRWQQDFTMKPEAPIGDEAMRERLDRNTPVQMKAVKAAVEARRARVVGVGDVPSNRRRGADLRTLLSPATVGTTCGFSGTVVLEPGEVITEHYHPYSEEYIHVVEGELRVDLGEQRRTVSADQAVFVPKNLRHRIFNDSTAPVRVVFFLSPLAPRPDLGHVDTETLAEWAANHQPSSADAAHG